MAYLHALPIDDAAIRSLPKEAPTIPSILPFLLLVWMLGFGVAAAWSAAQLGRVRLVWFGFGAVLGPVALVLLRWAPPASCRTCGSQTRGWLMTCWWCRGSVFGEPVNVAATVPAVKRLPSGPISQPVETGRHPAGAAAPMSLRTRLETSSLATVPASPSAELPAASIRAPSAPRSRSSAAAAPVQPTQPADTSVRLTPEGSEPLRVTAAPPSQTQLEARDPSSSTPSTAPVDDRPASMVALRVTGAEPIEPPGVLATAVYVAGTTTLESGHRYAITIRDTRLQILGPTDVAPGRIALERPVVGLEARSVEGRLILADRSGLVLAFMSVAGPSTRDVATAITEAARGGT